MLAVPISVGASAIAAKSAVTTRRFAFFARIAFASSVNDGAITASMNVDVSAVAVVGVDLAIEADDAAERRQRIRFARARRRRRRSPCPSPCRTGLVCLITDRGRLGELERDARGGVEVEQVGVRQLLALVRLPLIRQFGPCPWTQCAFWCGFSP